MPAGFTYLGQFIDHDITFDPTPMPDARLDPARARQLPHPPLRPRQRLRLRSRDAAVPVRLEGPGVAGREAARRAQRGRPWIRGPARGHDLPRNQQGRALIGDFRNDENVIVAQLHLLFLRFHNAVVDRVRDFEEAQRIVRWHYQWIVVYEFLPKIVGQAMADRVLAPVAAGKAPSVHREYFTWEHEPFIPVEFSGAAYRFGHSMVRDRYGIKRLAEGAPPGVTGSALSRPRRFHLAAREPRHRLGSLLRAAGLTVRPSPSFHIDTGIAEPLFGLPDGGKPLPRRNLTRGSRLGLPSGQEVACAMGEAALPDGGAAARRRGRGREARECAAATRPRSGTTSSARRRTLRRGRHLGPVGGRIVAEVLVGLLEGDPGSFLSQEPTWRPTELGIRGRVHDGRPHSVHRVARPARRILGSSHAMITSMSALVSTTTRAR